MRKKIICGMLVFILIIVLLTGCGNMSMGFGNFEFNKIHIDTHQYSGCIEIDKWYESQTGIEVATSEGNYYFSEGTYFLVEDVCPICDQY